MEPEIIMSNLSKQILNTLKVMEKAKTAQEKKICSEAVKNLTDSLGVFFNLMNNFDSYGDEFLDETDPFSNSPFDNDDKPIPF